MTDSVPHILHVVFSMDCLPAGTTGGVRGPERWDAAAAAPRAFAEALAEEGMGGCFFIAPGAMKRLREAVVEVQQAGCEAALLCHPQLAGYQTHLGSYEYDRQREILALGREVWEDALGDSTATLRAGFFSANDYTLHAACMEGFRQGSCSLPGRVDGEQCSMWFGSYPFAHHTDPLDRMARGTMEFYEVPVTSEFDAVSHLSVETYTPPHLRIEEPDIHTYARALITEHLDRMDEDEVEVRTVSFVTSNLVGWGKAEDPHAERLKNLCCTLREVADERGMELDWRSLADLHDLADSRVRNLMGLDEPA